MKPLIHACVVAAALILGGCASEPLAQNVWVPVSFSQEDPIKVDVARIDIVVSDAKPVGKWAEQVPIPPYSALEAWVKERLRPVGTDGVMRLTVQEAQVLEDDLPQQSNLVSLMNNENDKRYTARFAMRTDVDSPRYKGYAEANAFRSLDVSEDFSVNQRQRALYNLIRDTAQEFDKAMEVSMRKYLGPALK